MTPFGRTSAPGPFRTTAIWSQCSAGSLRPVDHVEGPDYNILPRHSYSPPNSVQRLTAESTSSPSSTWPLFKRTRFRSAPHPEDPRLERRIDTGERASFISMSRRTLLRRRRAPMARHAPARAGQRRRIVSARTVPPPSCPRFIVHISRTTRSSNRLGRDRDAHGALVVLVRSGITATASACEGPGAAVASCPMTAHRAPSCPRRQAAHRRAGTGRRPRRRYRSPWRSTVTTPDSVAFAAGAVIAPRPGAVGRREGEVRRQREVAGGVPRPDAVVIDAVGRRGRSTARSGR